MVSWHAQACLLDMAGALWVRCASLVKNTDNHLGPEAVAALGPHLQKLLHLHVLDMSST